jgi:hypothetical protein
VPACVLRGCWRQSTARACDPRPPPESSTFALYSLLVKYSWVGANLRDVRSTIFRLT